MAFSVTKRASSHNVICRVTPAILTGNEVLGSALESRRIPKAQSMLRREGFRTVGPHGVAAVKAALLLKLESKRTGTV